MLGTTERLLAYYLGGGFVILLGWAACVPDRRLTPPATRRYLRWTTIAAAVGLVHPAIALAARDIVGQVGVELPDGDTQLADRHARATPIVNTFAVLSALPAAALLAVNLA